MKKRILLIAFLSVLCAWSVANAAESEPNDTKAQANTLALNGNNSGAIGTSTDQDWWKVTTTGDGKLDVGISVSNGLYLWCQIYDNDGTTLLSQDYTSSTKTVSKDGLAAGTYYLKLYPYYAGEKPNYTISNTLTVPTQANDDEPNNTKGQAKVLTLNGKKTGHINYYYNGARDGEDWYKVTTTADGRLRLTMASANGQYVWAYLFDNDGTTQLAAGYTNSTSAVVNKDGLAAGTYYIRVNTYYNTDWAPYTLSDSLFSPTEPNDAEPDSTRGQALTLPLNGSKKGHINYYYNNHRDSVDWYKVTTNGDGRLRLTMKSGNGQNVWAYLFDNDAKTQLAAGYTSGEAVVVNKDGLAAGTYYVRVNTYYTTEWAPYTLSDSLFKPTQANDTEPNDSKAQALTLPLNGSVTGHTNYYYKLKKDSADWYKLTTDKDGMITIGIQSHNGQNVWAYLFDNNGTTQLAAAYSSGSTSYNFDGLKKGTYYIRVNTYYTSEWAPYTLSNTLSVYSYADDENKEPNDYFKQAKTLNSNATETGHVNFYYNGVSDAVDYHKINYTGTGNLTLIFSQENRFKYGSATPTWVQVYKDTGAAPISSAYYYSSSGDINFTNLTKGYYYIKVFTYYNGKGEHFSSYSIKNTYTQKNKAKIVISSYQAGTDCATGNTITYTLSKSHSPYKVQLYRFGVAYGSPVNVTKTAIFSNLPPGVYYATGYGDGATGNAKGTSDEVTFIPPVPTGLNTTGIKAKQATLKWSALVCADYFAIQYRVQGAGTWTTVNTNGNVTSYILKGLATATNYEWRVAAIDSGNGSSVTSAYSTIAKFKTKGTALSGDEDNTDNISIAGNKPGSVVLSASPNPANSYFIIKYNPAVKEKVTATLYSANGKAVWASGAISADALNNKHVSVNKFAGGLYYLKITDAKGMELGNIKISIIK
ncbi:MAG TPA: pre-peptidase C-terminal domain-containing protein [Parafilimonas sp.]|nr:pre-peptidase C-terminal domain-containing protein [Parafilimonas sp.]